MKIYKIIGIVALLAGCTPERAEWTPAESPKKNKVSRVVFNFTVHYPAHAKGMSDREKKKLHQFLKNTIPTPSAVTATLQEYGGHSEDRIKDIKRELLRHGIPNDLIMIDEDQEEGCHKSTPKESKSGVEIIIEKYLLIPPSCSNFSENIGSAIQSPRSSNFGCALEASFGMMVANPRDLIQGRPTGAYEGSRLADAIDRYRQGKITPLMDTGTTVPAGQQQSPAPQGSTGSTGYSGAQ